VRHWPLLVGAAAVGVVVVVGAAGRMVCKGRLPGQLLAGIPLFTKSSRNFEMTTGPRKASQKQT
jgi:hypothetical protein